METVSAKADKKPQRRIESVHPSASVCHGTDNRSLPALRRDTVSVVFPGQKSPAGVLSVKQYPAYQRTVVEYIIGNEYFFECSSMVARTRYFGPPKRHW